MWYIDTPEDLAAFADEHGLRRDWHEPDEQDMDAIVVGNHLDNAHGAHGLDRRKPLEQSHSEDPLGLRGFYDEMRVVLYTSGERAVAVINLASLLAWASLPHRKSEPEGHRGHVHVDTSKLSRLVDTATAMDISEYSTLELFNELRRRELGE